MRKLKFLSTFLILLVAGASAYAEDRVGLVMPYFEISPNEILYLADYTLDECGTYGTCWWTDTAAPIMPCPWEVCIDDFHPPLVAKMQRGYLKTKQPANINLKSKILDSYKRTSSARLPQEVIWNPRSVAQVTLITEDYPTIELVDSGKSYGSVVAKIWKVSLTAPNALPEIQKGFGSPKWRQPFYVAMEVDQAPAAQPFAIAAPVKDLFFDHRKAQWHFRYDVDGNGSTTTDEVVQLITVNKE